MVVVVVVVYTYLHAYISLTVQARYPGHTTQLSGCLSRFCYFVVSEREEGVGGLTPTHLSFLKTCFILEPVTRCKPSTYQPTIR